MNVALHPFRICSLFAGGGGLDLGVHRAVPGAYTVVYVEREAYAAATLVARMEEAALAPAPIWDDVVTFDGRPWRGVVDCIIGGFPCQDISVAGKGAGIEGERSGLWREYARIIGEIRPAYVFIENVAALVRRGLEVVLADLAALGFDAEWDVFRASDVGAPHRRERIFILAYANSEGRRFAPGPDEPARQGMGEQESTRRGERGGVAFGRPEVGGASLVDASGERRSEGRAEPEIRIGWNTSALVSGGVDVAHADIDGREVVGLGGLLDEQRETFGNDTHGRRMWAAWPPGPADAEGWREYIARTPGLEPAIRRGAHGLANRVERLRLLGNGVVPAQAELAFRELYERLHR